MRQSNTQETKNGFNLNKCNPPVETIGLMNNRLLKINKQPPEYSNWATEENYSAIGIPKEQVESDWLCSLLTHDASDYWFLDQNGEGI